MYIDFSDLKKNGVELLDAVVEAVRQEVHGKNLAWTDSKPHEYGPAVWLFREKNGVNVRYGVWSWSYGMQLLYPAFYGCDEKENGPEYVRRVWMGDRGLNESDEEGTCLAQAAREVLGLAENSDVPDLDALAEEARLRIEQREQELISENEIEASENMCEEIFRQRCEDDLPEECGSFEEWVAGECTRQITKRSTEKQYAR